MKMPWYKRQKEAVVSTAKEKKADIPPGGFTKCKGCSKVIVSKSLEENQMVCGECGYYYP